MAPSSSSSSTVSMLVSMFLVVLWTALAVGVVLSAIFPERALSASMFGSSGSSISGSTASSR